MKSEVNDQVLFELAQNSAQQEEELIENYFLFDNYEISKNKVVFKTLIPFREVDLSYEIPNDRKFYDASVKDIFNNFNEQQSHVLTYRFIDGLTLAKAGENLGISKQRVRQIEESLIRKIHTLFPKGLLHLLSTTLEDDAFMPFHDIPIKDNKLKRFFITVITHKNFPKSFVYDKELEALILNREYTYKNIKLSLKNFMESKGGDDRFQIDELKGHIAYLFPKIDSNYLIQKLLDDNELTKMDDNVLFFQNFYRTKREKVEFIYKLYKDGFETTKNLSELKTQLNIYFPSTFTKDSNRSIAGHASLSDNIVLWEWGKHIHVQYVQDLIDNYDFTDLLKYIDEELDNLTIVDLNGFYNLHEDTLSSFGIPSKYALHTMLKLKFPDDYSYQDSPRVSSIGAGRIELSNVLLEVMNENRIYTLEELSNILNTPKERIFQLIERVPEVIIVEPAVYIRREYLNISDDLLDEIVDYANKQVKELHFFYGALITNYFRDRLYVIGQYNVETTILDLLKKYNVKKDFNISNSRFVDKSLPLSRGSWNFHYIVEQFMQNRNEIAKNEIFEFFFIRGLDQNVIMNYYWMSRIKKIARVNEEVFVKLSAIGISDDTINLVTSIVETHYDNDLSIDDMILTFKDKLPKITIEWNRFLLADLLDRNLFRILPSLENPQYIEMKSKEESLNE